MYAWQSLVERSRASRHTCPPAVCGHGGFRRFWCAICCDGRARRGAAAYQPIMALPSTPLLVPPACGLFPPLCVHAQLKPRAFAAEHAMRT